MIFTLKQLEENADAAIDIAQDVLLDAKLKSSLSAMADAIMVITQEMRSRGWNKIPTGKP